MQFSTLTKKMNGESSGRTKCGKIFAESIVARGFYLILGEVKCDTTIM